MSYKLLLLLLLGAVALAHCAPMAEEGEDETALEGTAVEDEEPVSDPEAIVSRKWHLWRKGRLHCLSVSSKGNTAACPAGYLVTGCACGYACGSWNPEANGTRCFCHKGCMPNGQSLDWTLAMCCKVK
ncbi:predicted protein [Nematostella vectensis]|uniref:Uncharacterized protein n=1 Tax=Nematostella vectensis TaxID=45351 RepID=A7S3H4_NEMVE|nr:predicted protein [Nematostella vectensis]|eukprot:XP_001633834.1 predicted protein [Nematostella vectensis]